MKARTLRFFMNLWPPFVGAGIHVTALAEDYREAIVELRPHWYNRNYFGDHFGGSLYAMTDPFYALMLIHILGNGYRVTHAAGSISYLAPARGVVSARFQITDEHVAAIKAAAESGEKHLPQFAVDIVDRDGEVVARATHTAYVRRKPPR
jgi:acyl-coenzyme A thioesterase PaaI-like protein